MLLVVVQKPTLDDASIRRIAAVTGLSGVDVRQRLAGPTPRVLALANVPEPLHDMAAALAPLGVRSLVCAPACAPTDGDRLVPRSLGFHAEALIANDMADVPHVVPWSCISLIQRGVRSQAQVRAIKHTQRKFSPTRALLTGGLSLSRKVEVEEKVTRHEIDRFILLHRNDGEDDVMLYERRLHYQFLEHAMQASSYANLEEVFKRLRQHTQAPVDERVALPGFVSGLPRTAVDPLDLAIYLVQLGVAQGF